MRSITAMVAATILTATPLPVSAASPAEAEAAGERHTKFGRSFSVKMRTSSGGWKAQ